MMKPIKRAVARDFPSGSNLSVKGRPANPTLTKFVPPMAKHSGKRWGSAQGPMPPGEQLWRCVLPSGKTLYASSKGGAGWERIR